MILFQIIYYIIIVKLKNKKCNIKFLNFFTIYILKTFNHFIKKMNIKISKIRTFLI